MKRNILYIIVLLAMVSCESFLQKNPLDFGSEAAYFKNVQDLENAANGFYSLFPKGAIWNPAPVNIDNNSDNQISSSPNNVFYAGEKVSPLLNNSQWKFTTIRNVNYFLDIIPTKIAQMAGSEDLINHYWGELYFFRAYEYYRLLTTIGDVPILREQQSNDYDTLVKNSRRNPRNEVGRFIIEDLEIAIEKLKDVPPVEGRISKDAAKMLLARTALNEATWLKYHQGTPFVPDYSNSPNVLKYGPYTYPNANGSIDSEINFFLDKAIEYSEQIADSRPLNSTSENSYISLFNNMNSTFTGREMILATYYVNGINGHSISYYLARSGGNIGLTRGLIRSFLMANGLPVYASGSGYKGDKYVVDELQGRDIRLTHGIKPSGVFINGTDTFRHVPNILLTGGESCPTGYELLKYVSSDPNQYSTGAGTTATPVFRSAEAYLIYLEAYYERNGGLGGKCDSYWRELRRRANVNEDYNISIGATNMAEEVKTDFGAYSTGRVIDPTLYNIRRERRCELYAEGLRFTDLKRWRALDNMINFHIQGFKLYPDMAQLYVDSEGRSRLEPGVNVSPMALGDYLLPYRVNVTNAAYNGYTFQLAHYLEPIPVSEFRMTADDSGNIVTSPIYQNPGWDSSLVTSAKPNNDPSLR